MSDLLETLMILCFGLSWPMALHKSWVSRTAKGKSLLFEVFIWVGYIFGMIRKWLLYSAAQGTGTKLGWLFFLGWIFYALNFVEIGADMLLFVRNTHLDKKRDREAAREAEARDFALKKAASAEKAAEKSVSQPLSPQDPPDPGTNR